MGFTVRPVAGSAELRACEELQRRAWGFDDLDVTAAALLLTTAEYGGIVLGGFDGEGRLAGFCHSFPGRDERGRRVQVSHMLAVDPEARNGGLGRRLKWVQRREAIARGMDLMVWTFDPLESLNACLNFHKLGAVADRYRADLYGRTSSELHRGTPTDRLRAKWYLRSGRVRARFRGSEGDLARRVRVGELEAPWALRCEDPAAAVPLPGAPRPGLGEERVLCEIPAAIQEIKAADPDAANDWRQATRAALTSYLRDGYFVRECVRTDGVPRRTVYVLERGTPEPAGLED